MVPGTIVAFGGSTAPAGWVLCDGRAVSRATFALLFAVIGTQWGTGDGLTTFNVPDLRGRLLTNLKAGTGSDSDTAKRVSGDGANEDGNSSSASWIIKT
jgi:microcystin-dependent protein